MNNILFKPYNLIESLKLRMAFIIGGCVFSIIFLYVFEPYGIYNLYGISKLIAIGLYSGAGTIVLSIQFLLLQPLVIKKYTVLNTLIWLCLSFIFITISSTIVNAWLFNNGHIEFHMFRVFLKIIFSINIIPTSLFIIIHYNYITTKRLKQAIKLNEQLSHKTNEPQESTITIHSKTRNNNLTIPTSQLLYMVSADNYVNVFYCENTEVKHRLLRNTLTSIERDLNSYNNILRCHKSYIINKDHIEKIEGNAAGYRLIITGIPDPIPVSRSLNQEIMKVFN